MLPQTKNTFLLALPALLTACLCLSGCGGGGGGGGTTQQSGSSPVTPALAKSAPATPDPATPDPATADPATPDPATPDPATPLTGNALLNGRYAFVFSGSEDLCGVFVAGGTFVADGNGNITDGHEDGNFAGGIFAEQPFAGSYSIGADRRGTMDIANTAGANCGGAPTKFTFKLNVVSDRLVHFFESDGAGAARGTIEKQDTEAFSLAALDGPWAFLLDGLDFRMRLSIAGRFESSSGALSEGSADINNQQTVSLAQAIGGTLTQGANGRGTATLTTPIGALHFAYYSVSSEKLLLVGTDFFPVLSGTALRQTSAPYSNASLFGKYIFGMTASTHPRPQKVVRADAGFFQADGVDQISEGVLDRNAPSGVLNGSSMSGTYSVSPNGRGTATLSTEAGTENIVFYMTSESEGFVLQVDTGLNNVTSGRLRRQDTTLFSPASWQGPYGLFVTGSSTTTDPTHISGTLAADGVSALTTVQDIYDGSVQEDVSITGTYDVQSVGRGTAVFPSTDFNVYLASDSHIFLIGTNPGQVLFGNALKQEHLAPLSALLDESE